MTQYRCLEYFRNSCFASTLNIFDILIMPPKLYLVRHGESEHNVEVNPCCYLYAGCYLMPLEQLGYSGPWLDYKRQETVL